ncbi:MAG: DNA-binding response regulator [Chitinophagaceae bacterium BSSC1]|nr:MAG: DNA-binding response regulator [Chitinophagaceae bacterium BSSC1]
MIRAIIIDDEIQSRITLKNELSLLKVPFEIVAEANSVLTGVEKIDLFEPEMVFLDIHLGDGSGFDLIEKVKNRNFKIIFITAYNQYALQAFKVHALDYLLKPIVFADLKHAIDKAIHLSLNIQTNRIQYLLNDLNQKSNKISFSTTEGFTIHFIKDIIRCESDSNYCKIYFSNHEHIYLSKTLKQIEDQLINYGFERIHHSHLINMNHLLKYINKDGGEVIMSDGSKIPVSKRKKSELNLMLSKLAI